MEKILFVYLTNNNRIIYKSVNYDNGLKIGEYNNYNHLVIFKGIVKNKTILPIKTYKNYRYNLYLERIKKEISLKTKIKFFIENSIKSLKSSSGKWIYENDQN